MSSEPGIEIRLRRRMGTNLSGAKQILLVVTNLDDDPLTQLPIPVEPDMQFTSVTLGELA